MKRFRVWLRPSISGCKIRVDGAKNAWWLIDRLSRSFFFKSAEAMNENDFFPACGFSVPYGSQGCHAVFVKLLGGISEVELMAEPA